MYEYTKRVFEAEWEGVGLLTAGKPIWRIPKSHESMDEVIESLAREGWRMLPPIAIEHGGSSVGYSDVLVFFERARKER